MAAILSRPQCVEKKYQTYIERFVNTFPRPRFNLDITFQYQIYEFIYAVTFLVIL